MEIYGNLVDSHGPHCPKLFENMPQGFSPQAHQPSADEAMTGVGEVPKEPAKAAREPPAKVEKAKVVVRVGMMTGAMTPGVTIPGVMTGKMTARDPKEIGVERGGWCTLNKEPNSKDMIYPFDGPCCTKMSNVMPNVSGLSILAAGYST